MGAKAKPAAKPAAKGAAKNAAKGAAKPGTPAKAAAKHVKEVAGAESDAADKCLSASDKLALAKARASQKSGKERKLKVSDGWGCSKCRWRFDGCSQCKGKTFAGFVWNPSMKG